MRILITGATGFIGQHLIKRLIKDGHDIWCIVRKTSDKNIVKNLQKRGVNILTGDLKNIDKINLPKNINWIFHLAALVDTTHKYSYPVLYKENVILTSELAKKYVGKIQKFIFLSSLSVMGTLEKNQLVSETTECKPTSNYGRSKLEAEKSLLDLYRLKNFPVVILRPPTVYGSGEHYNFLKMSKAINQGKFWLIGGENHIINLCYIDNLIDALILAAKNNKSAGEIFLIDNGYPYPLKEVVFEIAKAEKKKAPSLSIPYALAYIAGFGFEILAKVIKIKAPLTRGTVKTLTSSFVFDISKAKKILGYAPQRDLSKSIALTISSYKEEGKLD